MKQKSCEGRLSYKQIAALLGTSHGNVQNIERRALEKMRRAAERYGIDASALFVTSSEDE